MAEKSLNEQENNDFVLSDDEYAAKINKIIRKDFFPYQSAIRRQNKSLSKLIHSHQIVSPDEMAYLLAVNPHHTPKIDKDEKSEKQLKKGNSKKKKPEKEEVSLTDFTRSHVSKNEVTFQKIMSADKNRHSRKHWWVSDLNKNNVFARPQSRTMRMLDKQGKEQVALVGCKNRLMFYPEAAPASKTITESKDPFVNKTIATENTRFCAQAFAVLTPKIPVTPTEYSFVPNTPLVEPSTGNVSPLVTWGTIDSTPVPLRAEEEAYSEKTYHMFEPSRREKIHRSLAKRMAHRRNISYRNPKKCSQSRNDPRASRPATPSYSERVDLGCLSVDRDLRRSYTSPAPESSTSSMHKRAKRS